MKNTEFSFEDFEIDFRNPLGEGELVLFLKQQKKILEKFMQLKDFQLMI